MEKQPIRVVIWGFGAMGSGMARMILSKQGFEITGVCDIHPKRVGKSISEVLEQRVPLHQDVQIQADIDSLIHPHRCDICLLATDSFTKKAYPKMKFLLERGVNVISTAEEMAYPKANEPKLAMELDQIAKQHGVTILGTGINPGMMMDYLVLMMTGVMADVESIKVARINSLSPFGETVMEEQGVGKSLEEYHELVSKNELAGHVGFKESAHMICDGLGLRDITFEQSMKPIITDVDRKSPYGFAKQGHLAGIDMEACVYHQGKRFLELRHPQQIEPQLAGVYTGDYIEITGTPPVHLSVKPEIDGGIGTIAICVNMIPHVINSRPGLKTMIDLPIPRAILGDVRDYLE